MSIAPNLAQILAQHVTLEVEGIDRMYLNVYVPRLPWEQGVVGFFQRHLGQPVAMVDAAEYGLMIWNGESKGTLNDMIKMVRDCKPVVVYIAPRRVFQRLRSMEDLAGLLSKCDPAIVQQFERELSIERAFSRPNETIQGAPNNRP